MLPGTLNPVELLHSIDLFESILLFCINQDELLPYEPIEWNIEVVLDMLSKLNLKPESAAFWNKVAKSEIKRG